MCVKTLEEIRKSKGWKRYRMAKELGISQTQYEHFEDNPISTREILMVKAQELSGLTERQFFDKLRKEVADYEIEALEQKLKAAKKK